MALGGGKIGRFTGSETGGIDGTPGDQTGRESRIQDYYRGSWDGVLRYNGKTDTGGASSSATAGDAGDLAKRVIAGEFGNGDARKQALGSNYSAVQKRVNEILGASGTTKTGVDVDAMARAVIRGDYGNGDERKRRLGSYYSVVQRRVNELLA